MDRLQGEIAGEQSSLTAARQTVKNVEEAKQATGNPYTHEQAAERARSLDAQAARPTGAELGLKERNATMRRLAGIAKYGRRQYEELDAGGKLAAQSEIDRELARLKGVNVAARHVAARHEGSSPTGEEGKVDEGCRPHARAAGARRRAQSVCTPREGLAVRLLPAQFQDRAEIGRRSGIQPGARLPRGGRAPSVASWVGSDDDGRLGVGVEHDGGFGCGGRLEDGARIQASARVQDRRGGQDRGGRRGGAAARVAPPTAGDRRARRGRRGAGGDVPAADADGAGGRRWPRRSRRHDGNGRRDRRPLSSGAGRNPAGIPASVRGGG